MQPGIAAIRTYFPDTTLGNETLVERFGFEREFLDEKIGVRSRPVAAPGEGVSHMAEAAARKLFDDGLAAPGEIGLLVVCTQNPDYRLPGVANILQHRLGLPQSIAAFDINLGCSGFVTGLSVVRSMMLAEGVDKALLVTTEAYSKVMGEGDRHTLPLFGDGAAATLVTADGPGAIGRFVFGSDGSGAEHLIVRGGGGLHPLDPPTGDNALFMDGRAIFTFMMRRVPKNVKDCLKANGLEMDDIDVFAFHQASRYMLENLRGMLRLPEEKVPVFLENTGNTVSSTIPVVLESLGGPEGLAGKRVLVAGFGVGLSWAAGVVHFK